MEKTQEAQETVGAEARYHAALNGIRAALSELDGIQETPQLYEEATRLACSCCGFDRAIFFAVDGELLVARSVHFPHDPEGGERIMALAQNEEAKPRLSDLIHETEMMRRRAPALVANPQNDPHATRALVEATETRSYVAAPILAEGRVLGFIHADHHHRGTDVDEVDRETLWAFAVGLGYVVERTILRAHLRNRRDQLERLARESSTLVHELTSVRLDLAHGEGGEARGGARGALPSADSDRPEPAPPRTLSPREREVMDLLIDGLRNADIAKHLFISESTAKAHVKHILRKLGARNRGEAISIYLRAPGAG